MLRVLELRIAHDSRAQNRKLAEAWLQDSARLQQCEQRLARHLEDVRHERKRRPVIARGASSGAGLCHRIAIAEKVLVNFPNLRRCFAQAHLSQPVAHSHTPPLYDNFSTVCRASVRRNEIKTQPKCEECGVDVDPFLRRRSSSSNLLRISGQEVGMSNSRQLRLVPFSRP